MFYSMNIAGLDRQLPLCPLNEKLMIAGFVMFGDAELTVACAQELLKKAPEFDYIITAEDDVISTGESLKAVEKLIEMAEVDYVGALAVLAEGDAAERKDIIFLERLPLFDSEGNVL